MKTYLDALQKFIDDRDDLSDDDQKDYNLLCRFLAWDVFHLDDDLLAQVKQAILQKMEREDNER